MSSQQPGPSRETPVKTNWNRCVLCQEKRPCNAQTLLLVNSTLSANLIRFSELNQLPIPIEIFLVWMKLKPLSWNMEFNVTKLPHLLLTVYGGEAPLFLFCTPLSALLLSDAILWVIACLQCICACANVYPFPTLMGAWLLDMYLPFLELGGRSVEVRLNPLTSSQWEKKVLAAPLHGLQNFDRTAM